MADGYPIGISAQPLDLGSIASSYMRSAVEQKLQEIKENKLQVSDNAQKALKALSVTAIPELSGKVREDYNKKIEQFRADVINKFRQREGKLSFEDQAFIEKGATDLMNEMNSKKLLLDQRNEMSKYIFDPRFDSVLNKDQLGAQLGQWDEDFKAGKSVKPLEQLLTENFRRQTNLERTLNVYGDVYKTIGQTGQATVNGRIFTQEQIKDPTVLKEFVDNLYANDPAYRVQFMRNGEVDQAALEKDKQATFNTLLSKQVETKPLTESRGRTGGGVGSLEKKQEIFETDVTDPTTGNQIKVVNFPQTMAQTSRRYNIGKAYDEKGNIVDINDDIDVTPVSFSKDTGMITVKTSGGQLEKRGEPLFSNIDLSNEALSDKKELGKTPTEIKALGEEWLKGADTSDKWTTAENVDIVYEDGQPFLKGTVKKYAEVKGIPNPFKQGGIIRTGSKDIKTKEEITPASRVVKQKEVKIPLFSVEDEKAKRTLNLPISDYRNLLTGYEKGYKIKGMTIGDYLESGATPQQSVKPTSGFNPKAWK